MRTGVLMLALVAVTLAAYGPTRGAAYVYEDFRYAQAAAGDVDTASLVPWSPRRSLTVAVWQVVGRLGRGAEAMHAMGLLLHIINGLLVLWAARALVGAGVAWVAAGVFLLHPLNVQAVAYASGFADVLSATGLLLVAVAVLTPGNMAVRMLMALLGAWIALTAKETGVVVFGLVPLLLWVRRVGVLRRLRAVGEVVGVVGGGIPAVPLALVVLAVCAWGAWTAADVTGRLSETTTAVTTGVAGAGMQHTALGWAAHQASAVAVHAWHVVWPFGLTVDHDLDLWPGAVQAVALVAVCGLPVLAWRWRRSMVGFGLAWVCVVLLPRFVVQTPWSYVNEHQMYAAMIGVAVMGAAAWRHKVDRT